MGAFQEGFGCSSKKDLKAHQGRIWRLIQEGFVSSASLPGTTTKPSSPT
jgi:hypothetical protein